jgi:hypothetical protein
MKRYEYTHVTEWITLRQYRLYCRTVQYGTSTFGNTVPVYMSKIHVPPKHGDTATPSCTLDTPLAPLEHTLASCTLRTPLAPLEHTLISFPCTPCTLARIHPVHHLHPRTPV